MRILFILLAVVICLADPTEKPTYIKGKVVEIEPVAVEAVLSLFNNVVLFTTKNASEKEKLLPLYEKSVEYLSSSTDQEILNTTLFAFCSLQKDLSGKLEKYGKSQGIKIITNVNHYELPLSNKSPNYFFEEQFPIFFKKISQPMLLVIDQSKVEQQTQNSDHLIVVTAYNNEQLSKTSEIYRRIFNFLNVFNSKFVAVFSQNPQKKLPTIQIHHSGSKPVEYPSSAVQALYKFTEDNRIYQSQVNDLVDFINIETIDLVTTLSEENYYRVFGSSINTQLLLIYREEDAKDEAIEEVRQQFIKAALQNKENSLKYERVLFAQASTEFLKEYFVDEMLTEPSKKFVIILTKTQYSSFQLRKFQYSEPIVSWEKLIEFISDVRLKKIEATYKSEPLPDNENLRIRKIVGKNFLSEVFEQKDKSVVVLFIDSKSENSSKALQEAVNKFVDKYYEAFSEKVNFGVMDLARNQHQSLTIKNAPELVLFEKSNKKKPKFFQGKYDISVIKNWLNYEVKDLTIPENFGDPILPLGGPTSDL